MTGVMNGGTHRSWVGHIRPIIRYSSRSPVSQHEAFPIGPPEDGPGDADAEHEGDGFSLPWEQFSHPILREGLCGGVVLQQDVGDVFAGRNRPFRLRPRLCGDDHRFAVDQGGKAFHLLLVYQPGDVQDRGGGDQRTYLRTGEVEQQAAMAVDRNRDVGGGARPGPVFGDPH